jgi:hypothetical protein
MQIPRDAVAFLLFLGALLTGFLTVLLFTDPGDSVSPEDIVFVAGRAERVERRSDLQLRVEGHNSLFRLGNGDTNLEVLKELHEGVPVKVGILKREQTSPPGANQREQYVLNICSLEVDGRTALSLDGYNRWHACNDFLGNLVALTLFLCFIGGLVYLLCHRHKSVAPDPPAGVVVPPRPGSFRDYVLMGLLIGIFAAFFQGILGWYGLGRAGRWVGPGIDGLLVGISGGFIFGMCTAPLIAALHLVISWLRKIRIKNSKLRSVVLGVQGLGPTPILFVMILVTMLAIDWNERGWIYVYKYVCLTIGFLIVWAMTAFFRLNLKQTPPSSGSKGDDGVADEAVSSANAPLA